MNSQSAKVLLAAGVFDVVLGLVFVALGGKWMMVGGILAACGLGIAAWAALKLKG